MGWAGWRLLLLWLEYPQWDGGEEKLVRVGQRENERFESEDRESRRAYLDTVGRTLGGQHNGGCDIHGKTVQKDDYRRMFS